MPDASTIGGQSWFSSSSRRTTGSGGGMTIRTRTPSPGRLQSLASASPHKHRSVSAGGANVEYRPPLQNNSASKRAIMASNMLNKSKKGKDVILSVSPHGSGATVSTGSSWDSSGDKDVGSRASSRKSTSASTYTSTSKSPSNKIFGKKGNAPTVLVASLKSGSGRSRKTAASPSRIVAVTGFCVRDADDSSEEGERPLTSPGGAETPTSTISRDASHNFETANRNEQRSAGIKGSKQKFEFEMDMNAGSTLAAGVSRAVGKNMFHNDENMFATEQVMKEMSAAKSSWYAKSKDEVERDMLQNMKKGKNKNTTNKYDNHFLSDEDDEYSQASAPSEAHSDMLNMSAADAVKALLKAEMVPAVSNPQDRNELALAASQVVEAVSWASPPKKKHPGDSNHDGQHVSHLNDAVLDKRTHQATPVVDDDGAVVPSGYNLTKTKEPLDDGIYQTFITKIKKPTKELSDLLAAMRQTDDSGSDNKKSCTRRKNACGALRLLTSNPANRVDLAWTEGVLASIASVFNDTPESEHTKDDGSKSSNAYVDGANEVPYQAFYRPRDKHPALADTQKELVQREMNEARVRAAYALLNLSIPVENRLLILRFPGFARSIFRLVREDNGEGRTVGTACLVYLSKSPANRIPLVKMEGLMELLTRLIDPDATLKNQNDKDDKLDDSSDSGTDTDGSLLSETDNENTDAEEDSDTSIVSPAPPSACMSIDDNRRSKALAAWKKKRANAQKPKSPTKKGKKKHTKNPHKHKRGRKKKKFDSDDTEVFDPIAASAKYHEMEDKFLHNARLNCFAALLHLIKSPENAYIYARDDYLVNTLVKVSNLLASPFNVHAIRIYANFSRHPDNVQRMVHRIKDLLPTLVRAMRNDTNAETRMFTCYAIENLSCDVSVRQELANIPGLLMALCACALKASHELEQLSAIRALKNLGDEPANIIPFSNSPGCFATLMRLAHDNDSYVNVKVQYVACDALATFSHWLKKIAVNGVSMGDFGADGDDGSNNRGGKDGKYLTLPTHQASNWEQWQ
eukprot:CAMPEP_0194402922 /NCGR_PEP_ID=MMETSP0176-20130528/1587_1 /TAXON_ID=216777 /ORGANISM="Proboscia alata, Strain PI-D3" /LENGTH=1026 /DNA_ID=CAMNT_0039200505 /DNA_START=119 /DNA_END=3199 /DNA_ORIENTATION=+